MIVGGGGGGGTVYVIEWGRAADTVKPRAISKLCYPVQSYYDWFGTLFKTGPQTLGPNQGMVYFSWQPTIQVMKVLVGRQSDLLMPTGACNPTQNELPKSPRNKYPVKICESQGYLKTIPYPAARPCIGKKKTVPLPLPEGYSGQTACNCVESGKRKKWLQVWWMNQPYSCIGNNLSQ